MNQRIPYKVEQRVRGHDGRDRRFLSHANGGQTRAPHDVVRPQEPRARSYWDWAARRLTLGALGTLLLPLTSEVLLPLPPVAMLYRSPVPAAEAILIGQSLGDTREEHQQYRRMGSRRRGTMRGADC